MSKKMTKQDLQNYIISEATKLYKIEVLKERKESIDKELRVLSENEIKGNENNERGEMWYLEEQEKDEWPELGDIVKFKDNLADSYGDKYLVVARDAGRHGSGLTSGLLVVGGDFATYDDEDSNAIYRLNSKFKTIAKTNKIWYLETLKDDIKDSDGNLSVLKIINSTLSGDIENLGYGL